jgi:peptide/nickel transport system permease protein
MTPYFLLTDLFIWLLVLGIAWYVKSVMSSPLSRENWRLVFQSRIASSCSVILVFALGITLLDSVHLKLNAEQQAKYGSPIISVLDVAVGELAYERETSYSAPLAIRALSKSTLETESGPIRDYARLTYGGAHLQDESERAADLLLRAYQGALAGGLLWMLSLILIWMILRSNTQDKNHDRKPANSLFFGHPTVSSVVWTLLIVFVSGSVVFHWADGYHVLGTDKVGVDVLYSSLKSLRTAMLIGLLTTLLTLPLGIAMGLAAGYFQGWVDDVIQYIYTTLNSIPSVLLIAATVLMLQVALEANPDAFSSSVEKADLRLFFLCAILGLTSWTGLARLMRGEVLKMRELDYVLAAKASGVGHAAILFKHLLPNLMHLVLIAMVMDFSGLVLAEAVLSYVGVGVDPSTYSYGTMINAARLELSREPLVWWSLIAAFVFMLILVLSANLFADAVRDAFDPRARQLKQSLIRV